MKYSTAFDSLKTFRAAALASAAVLLLQPFSRAQDYYTSGHGDFGIEYEAGSSEFEPHWHLHQGAVVNGMVLSEEAEYTTLTDLIAVTSAGDAITGNLSNTGKGSLDWLGVDAGTSVFRLGNENFEPDLGFGMEEFTEADWLDGEITIQLSNFSGPGDVAILSGTAPNFSVYASSYDMGASAFGDNSWQMGVGAHEHLVFYFSEAGDYQLTFTWTGTYIGEGAAEGGTLVTGTGTFGVRVVPEPSSWVLVALGWGGLVFLRRLVKTPKKV